MRPEKQGCTNNLVEVTKADLPLSCPMAGMRVWDAHPRVYLPIETLGEVSCPYCGARYILKHEPGEVAPPYAPADDC